jgi:predicted nucleic acid-binding protein
MRLPLSAMVKWISRRAVFIIPSRIHWDLFVKMCNVIEGSLVTDAYVAALAVEHGCELITRIAISLGSRDCVGVIH